MCVSVEYVMLDSVSRDYYKRCSCVCVVAMYDMSMHDILFIHEGICIYEELAKIV